ncbi:MAG: hypothetical protein H7239_15930 [Flavobacterium sp.]|nr:hypothetical protein [Flavobacterium sp.]
MNDEKYFNFPIQLLEGFMIDSKKVLTDISNYSIYENSLKLEHGTELPKIKASASFYGLSLGSIKGTLDNGKLLYNSIPTTSPKVGLNLTIFWDFYNNDKTEFDKICLLAFLSIKSLIGTKPYYKATNLYLWARMDGKIKAIVEVSELSVEVRKFANEYQTTKIKTALRNSWGLIHYARHTRGFYVSFKFTLKQLITEAEKCRISTKEKQYKEQEKLVLKEVLEQLKTTRPK